MTDKKSTKKKSVGGAGKQDSTASSASAAAAAAGAAPYGAASSSSSSLGGGPPASPSPNGGSDRRSRSASSSGSSSCSKISITAAATAASTAGEQCSSPSGSGGYDAATLGARLSSASAEGSSGGGGGGKKSRHTKKKADEIEMGIKNVEMIDDHTTLHTVEVLKRPGQTLGFYIREGDGVDRTHGVFISRIAEGSAVQRNGLMRVGDEIVAINGVNVTRSNLDDVVVLMSIPKRLLLVTSRTTRRAQPPSSPSPATRAAGGRRSGSVDGVGADTRSLLRGLRTAQQLDSLDRSGGSGSRALYSELNADDSNDSGLSSEHSTKGCDATPTASSRAVESEYVDGPSLLPPPPPLLLPPPPPLPAARATSRGGGGGALWSGSGPAGRSEMYASDGEHDYTPPAYGSATRGAAAHRTISANVPPSVAAAAAACGNGFHHRPPADAYSSDSEVVNGSRYHGFASSHQPQLQQQQQQQHGSYADGREAFAAVAGLVRRDDLEMQHWLRKFDSLSKELQYKQNWLDRLNQQGGTDSQRSAANGDSSQTSSLSRAGTMPYALHGNADVVDAYLQRYRTPEPLSLPGSYSHLRYGPDGSGVAVDAASRRAALSATTAGSRLDAAATTLQHHDGAAAAVVAAAAVGGSSPLLLRDLPLLVRSPLRIRVEDFPLYRPEADRLRHDGAGSGSDDGLPPGQLRVRVYCGHGLKSGRGSGGSTQPAVRELYCTFEIVSGECVQRARTAARAGAINFDWEETVELEMRAPTRLLAVGIHQWDASATAIRLGGSSYPTTQPCFGGELRLSAVLHGGGGGARRCAARVALKLEPMGILYVGLDYTPFARLPQQIGTATAAAAVAGSGCAVAPNAVAANGCSDGAGGGAAAAPVKVLFGEHLREVLAREAFRESGGGCRVPAIVRRCARAVEARGLSTAGVYEFEGCQRARARLRIDFQRDPWTVDLSEARVPDVHTVAGLMKDYLEELPESLFSAQAYDLIHQHIFIKRKESSSHSLGSHLVGKTTFSIELFLSYLHDWQKDTVVFLFDHFRRIVLNSTVNGMTAARLALSLSAALTPPEHSNSLAAIFGEQWNGSLRATSLGHADVLKLVLEAWPERGIGCPS